MSIIQAVSVRETHVTCLISYYNVVFKRHIVAVVVNITNVKEIL